VITVKYFANASPVRFEIVRNVNTYSVEYASVVLFRRGCRHPLKRNTNFVVGVHYGGLPGGNFSRNESDFIYIKVLSAIR
jgi:hypothetical protein